MSESEIPNSYLPDEIVKDILSRIPVKPLLQFRCVSKHWKHLITCPHLIKSHLKNASSSSTHHRILLPTTPLLSLSYNDMNESVELDCPYIFRANIEILGSCNGLVCLSVSGGGEMIIYNPTTRKHFKPVLSPQQALDCSFRVEYVYGFGCCSNSNEMKVVRFPKLSHEQWSSDIARDESNSWTSGVASSCYGFLDNIGTYLNGFLHWLACHRSDDYSPRIIASFNLSEETFRDLSLPPRGSDLPCYAMGVLQGCLFARFDDVSWGYTQVWLMKEYGVSNSWMKFVKIPFKIGDEDISCMKPLGSLNEDEIVLKIYLEWLVIYDAKKKMFRCVMSEYDLYGEVVVYVESLLSPEVLRLLY